jgi:hypothetical protein
MFPCRNTMSQHNKNMDYTSKCCIIINFTCHKWVKTQWKTMKKSHSNGYFLWSNIVDKPKVRFLTNRYCG